MIFLMKSISIVLFFISFFLLPPVLAQEDQNNDQRYKHLKTFSDVLHIIETSYVRKMSTEQLIQGAIKGMIKELDPHSHFLSADELKTFKKEARGRFRGFGMELEIKNKQLIVISVLENSPAQTAGLKAGHIITQINNQKTVGLNKKEINELLKNKMEGKINIFIRDPNSKKTRQLDLIPKIIDIQSVSYKDLGDQFLYIRINTFTERTLGEIRKIISKYEINNHSASYTYLKGMILDLRGNPGGLFEPAVKIADLFIKKGTLVSIKGRENSNEQIFKAFSHGTMSDFPMLVLIDAYSASSAEILAGALQENNRAILLGRKSFGKGSVQSLIPMNHGNAVKLTVAHYYTPKGHSIHKLGIQPDIEFKLKAVIAPSFFLDETEKPLKNTKDSTKKPTPSKQSSNIVLTGPEDTDFHQAVSLLKMFKFFSFASGLPSDP